MMQKKTKINPSEYFNQEAVPEEWFLPISEFSQSEWIKNYMDPDARKETMKVTLEAMVKEKQKERRKK
jgi:hypothetical protein